MNNYSPSSPCSKCGGEDVATSYHKSGYYSGGCNMQDGGTDGEHMSRWCRRCGYQWSEKVLGLDHTEAPSEPVCAKCGEPKDVGFQDHPFVAAAPHPEAEGGR